MSQLQRKIPHKAAKEFETAWSKFQKGATQEAAEHLQKALNLAPDYMEAHNRLGLCYIYQDRLDAAALEFQTAVNLDPGAAAPMSNLGVTNYLLKRYRDAETAARRALRLAPDLTEARCLLGLSLQAQQKFDSETLRVLGTVAGEFPLARLALADTLAKLGRKDEAAVQLKKYLHQPGIIKNPRAIEARLAALQDDVTAQAPRRNSTAGVFTDTTGTEGRDRRSEH